MRAPLALFCAVAALLLALAALISPSQPRLILFAVLSGAAPALSLRRQWRLTEAVCAAIVGGLLLWAVAAGALWTLKASVLLPWWPGAAAFLIGLWAAHRKIKISITLCGADAAAVLFMLIMAIPIAVVFMANGPVFHDGRLAFVARHWIGGDSFYLFSLAQMAVERRAVPAENPFLAGLGNYYPSLLHCGMGALSLQYGAPAALGIWRAAPVFLVSSCGLLIHAILRRASWRRGVAPLVFVFAGAAGWILLRPDLFIYPQTQAFVLSVLFGIVWLIGPGLFRLPPVRVVVVLILAAALVAMHAVTSAVVLIILGCECLDCLSHPSKRRRGTILCVCVIALAVAHVVKNTPPHPALGLGRGICANTMFFLREHAFPWLLPLAGGGLLACACFRRRRWIVIAAACTVLLGVVSIIYGMTRYENFECWFTIFNAQRFFHLGIFVVLPLFALGGLTTRRAVSPRLISLLLIFGGALILPNRAARETVLLINSPPTIISSGLMELLDGIRRQTPALSRLISNLGGNALPAFTGRPEYVKSTANFFGLATIAAKDYIALFHEHESFFNQSTPAERIEFMKKRRLTHVVVAGDWSDPTSASLHLARHFPTGSMEILINNQEALVLARR